MRVVIISGGMISDYARMKEFVKSCDFVICADCGYDHAVKAGIHVNCIVGDMDSISHVPEGIKVEYFPTRKDFTDTELAVQHAKDLGASDIVIMGATGSRLDHSLTNVLSLLHSGATIVDEVNRVKLVDSHIEIREPIGTVISLVPLTQVDGVTTRGLEYPLLDETLHVGHGRGVSNVVTEELAGVEVKQGKLLLIVVKEEK